VIFQHWPRNRDAAQAATSANQVIASTAEGGQRDGRVLRGTGLRILGGQLHGQYPVTLTFQLRREPLPAPRAVVSTMHQAEGDHHSSSNPHAIYGQDGTYWPPGPHLFRS